MEARREFLKKAAFSGAALWTGLAGSVSGQEKPAKSDAPMDVDVTAEWAKLNGDPKAKPRTNYKQGQVSPSSLKAQFEKAPSGYALKLPGGTPVPTPAVYKGKLYVSGGFRGKQY